MAAFPPHTWWDIASQSAGDEDTSQSAAAVNETCLSLMAKNITSNLPFAHCGKILPINPICPCCCCRGPWIHTSGTKHQGITMPIWFRDGGLPGWQIQWCHLRCRWRAHQGPFADLVCAFGGMGERLYTSGWSKLARPASLVTHPHLKYITTLKPFLDRDRTCFTTSWWVGCSSSWGGNMDQLWSIQWYDAF